MALPSSTTGFLAMSDTTRPKVRPRDAASIVLIRGSADNPEVLMGRRRKRASFLPNIYVFPGGRVDRLDRAVPSGISLPAGLGKRLTKRTTQAHAVSLAIAALRETFEETGYLLVDPSKASHLETAPQSPFWQALRQAGGAPDLTRLDYIARALTPTLSHKRFNTRFFMADANGAHGELLTGGELEDLHWLPFDEARRLPIVDVTEFVLNQAKRRWSTGRRAPDSSTIPFLHYVGTTQRIDHE
jgi:8-oxo-dGTP pyrophosphatase MutT (NUDIX family)